MNTKKIVNILAFVTITLVAVMLLSRYLMLNVFHVGADFVMWFDKIAFVLCAASTLLSACVYVGSKRNSVYRVILVVALTVIIVFGFILI